MFEKVVQPPKGGRPANPDPVMSVNVGNGFAWLTFNSAATKMIDASLIKAKKKPLERGNMFSLFRGTGRDQGKFQLRRSPHGEEPKRGDRWLRRQSNTTSLLLRAEWLSLESGKYKFEPRTTSSGDIEFGPLTI